jgi:hypothetical protein
VALYKESRHKVLYRKKSEDIYAEQYVVSPRHHHVIYHLIERGFLFNLIFGALFLYGLIGIFPIAPVEGDGVGIANGAAQIAEIGVEATTLAYRYNVQSGTYWLTAVVHNLTGAESYTVLALLSALAASVFILLSAALLSHITKIPFSVCGLVLLLFQESFTSGYYANSTVMAAVFLIAAFWVVTLGDKIYLLIVAGVLLGIGAWMRFDVPLVAPAILLLLHRGNWKQTLARTTLVAVISGLVALAAIYLSGSNIQAILSSAGSHRDSLSLIRKNFNVLLLEGGDLRSHVAFYTPFLLLLIAIGIFHLVRQRSWLILGIPMLGSVPFYAAYLNAITTPKYLYYLIPFAALLALYALPEIQSLLSKHTFLGRSILLILLMLFIGQYIIGWQFSSSARPNLRQSYPSFFPLFSTSTPIKGVERITLVMGAGSSVTTADGRRLLSGIVFAPLFQYDQKSLINIEVGGLKRYIEQQNINPLNILTTQYSSQQVLLNLLLNSGYDCQRIEDVPDLSYNRFACVQDGHQVQLTQKPIARMTQEEAKQAVDQMLSLVGTSEVLFVSTNVLEQNLFAQKASTSTKINNYGLKLNFTIP